MTTKTRHGHKRKIRVHRARRPWILIWTVAIAIAFAETGLLAGPSAAERRRVIVLTDFYKDPDDKQSMVRFLTYANEFDVEGLVATSLAYGTG